MTKRTPSPEANAAPRSARELHPDETKFRALFENMAEAACVAEILLDESGRPRDLRHLDVNPAYERHTGVKAADIVGRTMLELFPQAEPLWAERLGRVAVTGEPAHFQAKFGALGRWFEISAYQTEPGRFAAVFFDVSEHKRLLHEADEARLRVSADLDAMAKLQRLGSLFLHDRNVEALLLEIVDVAIAISGADFGNIQILDPQTKELRIVAQRGFAPWWIEYWDRALAGRGACGVALERAERVIVEDVERSPIFVGTPALQIQRDAGVRAVQSTPLFSRSGKLVGIFSTHYREPKRPDDRAQQLLDLLARQAADMIEHAQNEEALRRANANNEAIVATASDAILIIDEQGTIESFNQVASTMFGIAAEEAIGQNVRMLMPPPFQEEHDRYLSKYRASGEKRLIGFVRELSGRRKDGSIFPVQVWVNEWRVEGRRSFTGFIRDLTHQKRLEHEFAQAQKLEAVARLASGVAHDFNNLLAGILGCTRMLRKLLPSAHPADELVSEIRGAAERGAALSRQLVAFSRPKSSEQSVLELDTNIRTVEKLLRLMIGEDVELELRLAAGSGAILADPAQVEQILMNLALNARDAMPNGGRLELVTREVQLSDARSTPCGVLPPGDYLVLEVADSGVGMDAATRARAFEPFFTTKEPGRGTGLGLYTVYSIVKQLGGAIEVESEVGRGSTFRLHLRKHQGADERVRAPKVEALDPLPGGRETILLVEDERLLRFTLRHLLLQLGYRVLVADRPEEALRLANEQSEPIELLLTDMVMPGLSGAELARRLAPLRPAMKVIFMSAFPTDVLVSQGRLPAGVTALEKPFDEIVFAKAIRDSLDGRT